MLKNIKTTLNSTINTPNTFVFQTKSDLLESTTKFELGDIAICGICSYCWTGNEWTLLNDIKLNDIKDNEPIPENWNELIQPAEFRYWSSWEVDTVNDLNNLNAETGDIVKVGDRLFVYVGEKKMETNQKISYEDQFKVMFYYYIHALINEQLKSSEIKSDVIKKDSDFFREWAFWILYQYLGNKTLKEVREISFEVAKQYAEDTKTILIAIINSLEEKGITLTIEYSNWMQKEKERKAKEYNQEKKDNDKFVLEY